MSIPVHTIWGRSLGELLNRSSLPFYQGGYFYNLVFGLGLYIEASPIYAGYTTKYRMSGSHVGTSDNASSWVENTGSEEHPVYVTRDYVIRTTTTVTYDGTTITRSFNRDPMPADIDPVFDDADVDRVSGTGLEIGGFGDYKYRVFSPPAGRCYMMLAQSVGSRSPYYEFGGGPELWQTYGLLIDPTRPAMAIMSRFYTGDSDQVVIGTSTVSYSVLSGTPPPGYTLPDDVTTDIHGFGNLNFWFGWGALPDVLDQRVGPASLLTPSVNGGDTLNSIDISGWDNAKWRDYRGLYTWPDEELTPPDGYTGTVTVRQSVTFF